MLPWIIAPNEVRTPFQSLVFNSPEYVRFNITGKATLYDALKDFVINTLNLHSVDKADLLKFINIKENASISTVDNYDIIKVIVEQFILNVFLKIYQIDKIIDEQGNSYDFINIALSLDILNATEDNIYTIIFKR